MKKEFAIKFIENYPVIDLDGKAVFVDLGAPSMSRSKSISIMGHCYNGLPTALDPNFNLDIMEQNDFHVHLDAQLGIDILKHYEVIFDYPNGRLILNDTPEEHTGESIPFDFNRFVTVKANVAGQPYTMLVDSGCKQCFIKHSVLAGLPVVGTMTDYLPHIKKVETLNLCELQAEVGPLTFTAKWANQPYENTVPFDGTLGYGFLCQQKMTFNFNQKRIWLD